MSLGLIGESLTFQFTHPGRGATRRLTRRVGNGKVSIHAPREGCDTEGQYRITEDCGFNSRTPGGVRHSYVRDYVLAKGFQFTHPGRGATAFIVVTLIEICFNSRTPGGVRLSDELLFIPALKFQFTHPGRGATVWCKVAYYRADKQA